MKRVEDTDKMQIDILIDRQIDRYEKGGRYRQNVDRQIDRQI